MPRREKKKENSADKNGEEVGVPPAAIDENTGKESDSLKENGDDPDELPSAESEFVNGESDCEKKKDLSQTKNPLKLRLPVSETFKVTLDFALKNFG